jgi:hypothetical protein
VVVPVPTKTIGERAAEIMSSYVGRWGGDICKDAGRSGYWGGSPGGRVYDGQCKAALNCVVFLASGGRTWPAGWTYAGAQVVSDPAANARRGDIMQKGIGVHTAIVLDNLGNGRYRVVDSNYGWNERVSIHEYVPGTNGVTFYRYTAPAS